MYDFDTHRLRPSVVRDMSVLVPGLRMPKPTLKAEAKAAFKTVPRLNTKGGIYL